MADHRGGGPNPADILRKERGGDLASRIYDVLPEECWVTRSDEWVCTELVGGGFPNGAKFTEEMCCLPCRIRKVIDDHG